MTVVARTLRYAGPAWTEDDRQINLPYDHWPIHDEVQRDRSVGIMSGGVWIEHPLFRDPLWVPDEELAEFFRDLAEDQEQDEY